MTDDLELWLREQEHTLVIPDESRWRRFWDWVHGKRPQQLFKKAERESLEHPERMRVFPVDVEWF
jgi:hypothetical protein